MVGKIVKGISGFYYVHVMGDGIYECRARGKFRNDNIKPLVGDDVEIAVTDEVKKTGNVIEIQTRKNELIRPAVANIDQALVVFAIADPMPNLNLLDRFLVTMERNNLDTIICFNKIDLVDDAKIIEMKNIYVKAGYHVVFTSTYNNIGVADVKRLIEYKTTAVAGPSGVGKSSLLNKLVPDAELETGEISKKIKRGKNTTRHTEIISAGENTYLYDTPGFSSLYVNDFPKEELKDYFKEFEFYNGKCKFNTCNHVSEPECRVKDAVKAGIISKERYVNYLLLFDDIKNKR